MAKTKTVAEKKITKKVTSKKAPAKKTVAKKAAVKKTKAKTETKKPVPVDLESLDRKGLATRVREIKRELMAIRFNMQSPSLSEYRKKKKEVARILSQLG